LKYHIYRKHDSERRFSCKSENCKKTFKTPNELKQHQRKIHEKSICHICDQNFESQESLLEHLQSVHTLKQNSFLDDKEACFNGQSEFLSKSSKDKIDFVEKDNSVNALKGNENSNENSENLFCAIEKVEEDKNKEKANHDDSAKNDKKKRSEKATTRKPFSCKFCGFQFTKLEAAKTHIEINHLVKIGQNYIFIKSDLIFMYSWIILIKFQQ
jgi:hypothetical protein